jgi:hypothetical protein
VLGFLYIVAVSHTTAIPATIDEGKEVSAAKEAKRIGHDLPLSMGGL